MHGRILRHRTEYFAQELRMVLDPVVLAQPHDVVVADFVGEVLHDLRSPGLDGLGRTA